MLRDILLFLCLWGGLLCVNFPQVPSNMSFWGLCPVVWYCAYTSYAECKGGNELFSCDELGKCGRKVLRRLCVHGWQLSTSSHVCMPDSIRRLRCRSHIKVALTINVWWWVGSVLLQRLGPSAMWCYRPTAFVKKLRQSRQVHKSAGSLLSTDGRDITCFYKCLFTWPKPDGEWWTVFSMSL
jgi:hypothetical protein